MLIIDIAMILVLINTAPYTFMLLRFYRDREKIIQSVAIEHFYGYEGLSVRVNSGYWLVEIITRVLVLLVFLAVAFFLKLSAISWMVILAYCLIAAAYISTTTATQTDIGDPFPKQFLLPFAITLQGMKQTALFTIPRMLFYLGVCAALVYSIIMYFLKR